MSGVALDQSEHTMQLNPQLSKIQTRTSISDHMEHGLQQQETSQVVVDVIAHARGYDQEHE